MKKIYFFLIALFVSLTMFAGEVTEQQALQKAQQFMKGKQFKQKNLRRAPSTAGNAYYVFNVENNGGFIIVAGDDRVKDILGYSERGSFDLTKAPSNVRWWLSQYEKAVNNSGKGTRRVLARRTETVKEEIAPFITTTWGQFSPYNDQTPEINGEHCVTGCVATSMAQVMNYTKCPESATGEIAGYTTKTNQIAVPKLEATTFNWSNMTNSDIARLMRYCGQAVKMDYGLGESGSSDANIPGALIGKFGYDKNMRIVYRNGYNSETWENLIYNELKAGRPVIYGGQSGNGGHSFICHGYRDDMFYINWGWDGLFDGYFALTALNPDGNGAYGRDQTAIIGIQKSTGGDVLTTPKLTVTQISFASNETVTRSSASDNFTGIKIGCTLQNSFTETQTVQSGFALYQGTELKSVLGFGNVEFSPGIVVSPTLTFAFGANVPDGTYRIIPVYRESESAEWIAAEGSNYRYVEAVIAGNTLSLKVMPDAAHDERLVFNPISTTEAEVSAANTDIEGDIVVPEVVTIDGKIYKVTAIANHGFSECTKMTSIKMPSSMLYWFLGAFQNCSQLKTLTIPKSLRLNTNNGMWTMEYCISGCDNLTELIIEEGNTDFCVVDGALLTAQKDILLAYLGGLKNKEYTIPESVTGVTIGAFSYQKFIEVINWNSKLQEIPIDMFIGCSSLKKINNIDNVIGIGEQAFWGAGLEELILPSKLQEIGKRGFAGCKKLKKIEIPQSLKKIGSYAFGDCSQLTSITVHKGSPLSINSDVFSEDVFQNAILYVPTGRTKYYRQDPIWGSFKEIRETDMPDVIISDNPFNNIDENQMLFGYYRSDEYNEVRPYGGEASGTYKACISFQKESLQSLVGNSIKHFRFALADTNISDVKFWIGSTREKTDLCLQSIENLEIGWNVVTLEKPYTITGDSIFMGIEYTTKGSVFPICYILGNQYSDSRAAEPGSALLYGPYGNNNKYEWSEEEECLSMQCIIEGNNLPMYDVHMSALRNNDQDLYYYQTDAGTRMQFSIWLKNWGKKFIGNNFNIKAEIDGLPIDGDYYGDPLNDYDTRYKIYFFNLPTGLSIGVHELKIYIDELNGDKPLYPADDSKTYKLRIYKEGMKRQKILVENLTATWCHDALYTNQKQDLLLDTNTDLALVAFHSDDELTSKASQEYFDRNHCIIGLTLDANRFVGADQRNLEFVRNMPAFADVNISAQIDKNKRILNIWVEGDKNSEFDKLHSASVLTVLLTEDNLIAPQFDELNGTWIADYKHKGVLRASVSNMWGDPIIWNGSHYKMNYIIHLDNEWDIENMHVIAFMEEDLEGEATGKPVINCNEMLLKDAETVNIIEPIENTKETSFSGQITANSDLENTVIDNTYYNMDAASGDGYDATEQALVLNSTTTDAQMTAIQNAEVGDAAVKENYSGIIFEIPAGQGTITVDTKTVGTHVLNVQIGNGAPTQVQKSERGTADVSYNVSTPTYVYLYAGTQGGSAAPLYRAGTAGANSVLLYGYKVTIGGTGIEELKNVKMEDLKYFDLNGRKVNTPGKGVYIINGRKVVIK